MTYAGRLDPMAEGVLLVLTDDDRLRKDEFMALTKEYKATMVFGVTSDSFDALGLVTKGGNANVDDVENAVNQVAGMHELPFPAYSSYKVQGKPLHWWAQQGRLDEIEIPLKKMEVVHVSDVHAELQSAKEIVDEVIRKIHLVTGDFRQKEIINRWRETIKEDLFIVATCTLQVTSGTYIRSLAQELGQKLCCGALLLGLERTRVGEYPVEKSVRLSV